MITPEICPMRMHNKDFTKLKILVAFTKVIILNIVLKSIKRQT